MTRTSHKPADNSGKRHDLAPVILAVALALGPGSSLAVAQGTMSPHSWAGTDMTPSAPVRAASLVTSLTAEPTVLGPGGGVVRVSAALYDAAQCRLRLLSHQGFPVVYASNLRPCVASFVARVEVGGNSTGIDRVVSFELVATHGRYNSVAGPERSVSRFSVVVLDRARTPFIRRMWSGNWSGYAVEGGPFGEATGSFFVPSAIASGCGEELDQWVGIDGAHDQDLIQAGIGESSTDPSTGQCRRGRLWLDAWWEVLPGASRPVPMAVHAGDLMYIAISAQARPRWEIGIKDQTTGQAFSISVPYAGPATSAEWVIEAPTVFSSTVPLVPYDKAAFAGLKATGPVELLDEIWLVEGNDTVSVPESVPGMRELLGSGFSVEYTG